MISVLSHNFLNDVFDYSTIECIPTLHPNCHSIFYIKSHLNIIINHFLEFFCVKFKSENRKYFSMLQSIKQNVLQQGELKKNHDMSLAYFEYDSWV